MICPTSSYQMHFSMATFVQYTSLCLKIKWLSKASLMQYLKTNVNVATLVPSMQVCLISFQYHSQADSRIPDVWIWSYGSWLYKNNKLIPRAILFKLQILLVCRGMQTKEIHLDHYHSLIVSMGFIIKILLLYIIMTVSWCFKLYNTITHLSWK